jgi:hypothetical protein
MTTPRGDALSHQRFRGSPTMTLQRFRFDRTSDSTIRLSAARLVAIPHQRGEKSFRLKMHGHHERRSPERKRRICSIRLLLPQFSRK